MLQQLEVLSCGSSSIKVKVNVTNPLGMINGILFLEVLDIGGEPGFLAAALLTRGTRDRHKFLAVGVFRRLIFKAVAINMQCC